MQQQSRELYWLQILVAVMGLLQLGFAIGALSVQDLYLLKTVIEERMGFLDRIVGYRTNSVQACLKLRNLQLDFLTASDQISQDAVDDMRSRLRSISTSMLEIHSRNYVSPPSSMVPDTASLIHAFLHFPLAHFVLSSYQ